MQEDVCAACRQSCGGKNPVHLCIDPTGRWIITANYTAGSVGVVPIEKDGTLGTRADLVTLQGEPGPDRVRQAGSHPHDIVFDPSGAFSYIAAFGSDRVAKVAADGSVISRIEIGTGVTDSRHKRGPRGLAINSATNP